MVGLLLRGSAKRGRAGERTTEPSRCDHVASTSMKSRLSTKSGKRLLRVLISEGAECLASGVYIKHVLEQLTSKGKSGLLTGRCAVFAEAAGVIGLPGDRTAVAWLRLRQLRELFAGCVSGGSRRFLRRSLDFWGTPGKPRSTESPQACRRLVRYAEVAHGGEVLQNRGPRRGLG